MCELAAKHPRCGYRRIHKLLLRSGWRVNHKRVQRLWCREGMRVAKRGRRQARIGDSGNPCTRRRAEAKGHVWTYDFLSERTEDGHRLKILAVLDKSTRECLCLLVARSITAEDVVGILAAVMVGRGLPGHIRSDSGPEIVATAIRDWLQGIGPGTLFIDPGALWESACVKSFHSRLRDELRGSELFTSLVEARYLVEHWRVEYHT